MQAVGISSRMAEGTQSTIDNKGDITVNVEMEDARQTNVEEDPTAGNLYGINVFNSGTPCKNKCQQQRRDNSRGYNNCFFRRCC